jgi:hypothetical protein
MLDMDGGNTMTHAHPAAALTSALARFTLTSDASTAAVFLADAGLAGPAMVVAHCLETGEISDDLTDLDEADVTRTVGYLALALPPLRADLAELLSEYAYRTGEPETVVELARMDTPDMLGCPSGKAVRS